MPPPLWQWVHGQHRHRSARGRARTVVCTWADTELMPQCMRCARCKYRRRLQSACSDALNRSQVYALNSSTATLVSPLHAAECTASSRLNWCATSTSRIPPARSVRAPTAECRGSLCGARPHHCCQHAPPDECEWRAGRRCLRFTCSLMSIRLFNARVTCLY